MRHTAGSEGPAGDRAAGATIDRMIGRSAPFRGATRPVAPGPIARAAPPSRAPRRQRRRRGASLRRQLGVRYVWVTSVAVLTLEAVALIAVAQGILSTRRLVHHFVAEDLAPVATSLLVAEAPAGALRAYLERPVSVRDDEAVTSLTLPRDPRGYTVVLDARGTPWFDNRAEASPDTTLALPAAERGLAERALDRGATSVLLRPARTATATPLVDPSGRTVGALLQVSTLLPAAPGLVLLAGVSLLLGGLAVVGIGTTFGLVASRPLTRRISALGEAADAWTRGDFARSVDDPSEDELGRLARRLDRMAEQLGDRVRARAELARVRERARLARDLHDTVKQELFGASLLLSALSEDRPADAGSLQAARDAIQRAKRDLGELIEELRPLATVAPRSLHERLRAVTDAWPSGTTPRLRLDLAPLPDLPPEVAEALERIAREALSNAVRHADAGEVVGRLRRHGPTLRLDVADDGRGYRVEDDGGDGLGMASMRARAASIGGRLRIVSRPGQGTLVSVEVAVPLDGLAAVADRPDEDTDEAAGEGARS